MAERIASFLVVLAVLLACESARCETRQERGTVLAPGKRAEAVRAQIRSLERERRLRSRAVMLVQGIGLFDDFTARSRSVIATRTKADTEGLLTRVEMEITVGHETAGVGGGAEGAMGLTTELEELKAEIQKLRSIEKCELRIEK